MAAAATTTNFISKSSALAAEASAWVAGNIVGLLVATAIGIAIALAMLVGVHLARWSARCALYRRFGPDAHPDHPHRED